MRKNEKQKVLDLLDKAINIYKHKHAIPEYEKTLTYKNEVNRLYYSFRSFALFKFMQ